MKHLQVEKRVSERRACMVIGQARSSQRYQPQPREAERELVRRILAISARRPRYGYRRVWALLRREGWAVNRKRIYRLWRAEGLKVPCRRRKRRALGQSANGVLPRQATRINQVWSYDFLFDQTTDGRRLKWLPIVDEYSREDLALEVERRMGTAKVIQTLDRLVKERGAPGYIRSDNGPEFIARAIRRWIKQQGIKTLYIEPGCPWQNAYSESFNSRLRDELLDREEFGSLIEAKVLATDYRWEYNHQRPHSALAYQTPMAFAAACRREKNLPPPWGRKKAVPKQHDNNQKLSFTLVQKLGAGQCGYGFDGESTSGQPSGPWGLERPAGCSVRYTPECTFSRHKKGKYHRLNE